MSPIVKDSLDIQAASTIREWILNLELEPGQRLLVDNLADQMGISRTPVREALKALGQEGLVVYDNNTYRVKTHTLAETQDLFAIRRSLELLAVEQAAARVDGPTLKQIESLCEEYDHLIGSRELESLMACDLEFHRLVVKGAKNARLESLLTTLNQQCLWVSRFLFSRYPDRYASVQTLKEHKAVLSALKAHDPHRAKQEMSEHLHKSEERKLGSDNLVEHSE